MSQPVNCVQAASVGEHHDLLRKPVTLTVARVRGTDLVKGQVSAASDSKAGDANPAVALRGAGATLSGPASFRPKATRIDSSQQVLAANVIQWSARGQLWPVLPKGVFANALASRFRPIYSNPMAHSREAEVIVCPLHWTHAHAEELFSRLNLAVGEDRHIVPSEKPLRWSSEGLGGVKARILQGEV